MLKDCEVGCNAVSWAPAAHVGGMVALGDGSGGAAYVKRVAAAGSDGKVRLHRCSYDPASGREVWEEPPLALAGSPHKEWVRDVAWSPASGLGSNMLASCSDDGVVAIWQQATPGNDLTWAPEVLPAFQAPVWRVSWSVTGHLLAVSAADNSVTLWKQSLAGAWQQISTVADPTLQLAAGRPGMGGY